MTRTDTNNNPAAFTTAIAMQAGLVLGVDYKVGTQFPAPSRLFTAHILGDPVAVTIRVIDALTYYTKAGLTRWDYIAIPGFIWNSLTPDEKRDIVGFHYRHEGGTLMRPLFPNYDQTH